MTNTKKITIILTPISNSKNRKRCKELLHNYCRQNNFTASRIIENKKSIHHADLRKLIDEIKKEPKGTFTIFIEDTMLNDPNNIVLFASLGTLYLLGLIHAEICKKSYNEVKLYNGIDEKNDFLSIADFCLYYTLERYKNN